MKNFFTPIILAIVAITICSCDKEDKIIAPDPNSGSEISFSATIGTDQLTDTLFNDQSLKLFWKSNDKVYIWHKETNSIGNYKASADSTHTNLVIDSGTPLYWVDGVNIFSSVYVCNNTSLDQSGDCFTISLSKNQIQSKADSTDHFGNYMAMKGFFTAMHSGTDAIENVDIPFKPLYSILEFDFPNDATKKVAKVEAEITSGSDQVLAFETANVSKKDNSLEISNPTATSKKVTLTFSTPMDLSKGINKGWMIVKPGSYDSMTFTYTYESGTTETKDYTNVTIAQGTISYITTFGNIVHNTANSSDNTINTLADAIMAQVGNYALDTLTSLKVIGTMNQADFANFKTGMKSLTTLDLSEVSVMGTINIDLDSETKQYITQIGNAIPYNAFRDNTTIKSILLPKNITTIGYGAFYGCSELTGSLTIPEGVTTIGEFAFYNCLGFTGNLTIPEGVTTINEYAFYCCSGLTGNLTIPRRVTTIKERAFEGCYGFNGNLIIPEGVTIIDSSAFEGCGSLTGNLTIPEGVTIIHSNSFRNCSSFTGNLTIPSTVITIETGAFYGCSGFNGTLTIPSTVTTIEYGAIYGCSGLTGNLTIPEGVTTIGNNAFSDCSGFNGTLTIPSTVTTIGEYAFSGCFRLTGNLTIPEGVTTIDGDTFSGCSGFNGTLTIPSTVKTIEHYAFYGCSGFIDTLTIPSTVTTIEKGAFFGCSGFTGNLTIPEGVTTIEDLAFHGCSGLTSLSLNWMTELKLPQYNEDMFPSQFLYWDFDKKPVIVPVGSKSVYKNRTDGWQNLNIPQAN